MRPFIILLAFATGALWLAKYRNIASVIGRAGWIAVAFAAILFLSIVANNTFPLPPDVYLP